MKPMSWLLWYHCTTDYCCFVFLHVLLRDNNNQGIFIRKTQIHFASFLSLASLPLYTKNQLVINCKSSSCHSYNEKITHLSLVKYMQLLRSGDFHNTIGILLITVSCHTHTFMSILDAGNWGYHKIGATTPVDYQSTWKLASRNQEKSCAKCYLSSTKIRTYKWKEVFKIVIIPSTILERPAEESKLISYDIWYAERLSYYQV